MLQAKNEVLRKKSHVTEFEKVKPKYEIKRIGSQVYLTEKGSGIGVSLSRAKIEALCKTIEENSEPTKITITGLSRAQLGRILGDLQENSTKQAFVKRKPHRKKLSAPPASYDIVMKEE